MRRILIFSWITIVAVLFFSTMPSWAEEGTTAKTAKHAKKAGKKVNVKQKEKKKSGKKDSGKKKSSGKKKTKQKTAAHKPVVTKLKSRNRLQWSRKSATGPTLTIPV